LTNCTWDPDTGTLTTYQEAAEEKNCVILETALGLNDVFAEELAASAGGNSRRQAPPPETLFNLNKDWSMKTVHCRHEQAAATPMGNTPPWKGKGKVVNVTNSSEESASSSSKERPRTTAVVEDKDFPTSSN
jgi:hypothetical protein